MLPDDMKSYRADAFQIIRPATAARWLAVVVLFVWLIESAPQ